MQYCPVLSDIATMVPSDLVSFTTTWQEQQQALEAQAGRPIPGTEVSRQGMYPHGTGS